MKNWAIVALQLAALALAAWVGHHVTALSGERDLATAQADWAKERAGIANARATAEAAQRRAEQGQAQALNQAAQNYEKGKTDAAHDADQAIADLAAGNRRLRDEWSTCRATSAAVSSAAGGLQPDGQAGLREEGIRSVLRTVGECQSQRDSLQDALTGERAQNP